MSPDEPADTTIGSGPPAPNGAPTQPPTAPLTATIGHESSSQYARMPSAGDGHDESGASCRFHILRPHAQGGLGMVFVARDQQLNRDVALKEIQPRFADDDGARSRFMLEAEITGALEHPGIVPVYGMGTYADGRPFYAMRFIKGDSLKDAIGRFHGDAAASDAAPRANPFRDSAKQLEMRQLLGRFIDVCQAIEYAHSRGVLHRDIKPSNIMLGKYGETLVVDWGLAKAVGQAEQSAAVATEAAVEPASGSSIEPTQTGSAVGTLAYMSPEQANGCLDMLGPAADIFSLGATLFHILTGRSRLEAIQENTLGPLLRVQIGDLPSPRQVLPTVPRALDAICRHAMAFQPADRYPSAQALAADVERYLADEAVAAAPETGIERGARWARKHKGWVQAGSVAVVLLAIVASVAALLVNAQRQVAESLADKNLHLADERQLALHQEELQRTKAERARVEAEQARNEAVAASHEAEKARNLEALAKEESIAAKIGAERQLAESYLDRGRNLCEQNDVQYGLLWMARGLAVLPPQSPELEHVIRANLGAWLPRIHAAVLAVPQGSGVNAVAYSPSGELFATACENGLVRVWSSANGKPTTVSVQHPAAALCVAFSPDGKLLASGGRDNAVRFWDAATGELVGKPCMHSRTVNTIAFHPRGKMLVAGIDLGIPTGGLQMWDVANCEPTGPQFDTGGIFSVAFSADGKRIVTGTHAGSKKVPGSGSVQLWDAETGLRIGEDGRQRFRSVAAAISADGKIFAGGSWDTTACLWDAETGRLLHPPLRHPGTCNSVAFSPDGKRLLTGGASGHAHLWDVQSGERIGPTMNCGRIHCVAFSPDGSHVLVGGGSTVWIWKTSGADFAGQILTSIAGMAGLGISPDGKSVLVGSQVFDLATRQPVGSRVAPNVGFLGVAVSPDGRRVLFGCKNADTQIYDLETHAGIGKPLTHTGSVCSVAFSPDGGRVATSSYDGTAQIWNAETGAPVGPRMKLETRVWRAAFHPNGKILATSCEIGRVQLWDAFLATAIGPPIQCPNEIYEVAFHPSGNQLAIGGFDSCARIWDLQRQEFQTPTLPHSGFVGRVAYSTDGTLLATGCNDAGARIWDTATNKQIGPTFGHDGPVMALILTPDNSALLTGTEYPNIRIWQLPPPIQDSPAQFEARLADLCREELSPTGELRVVDVATWLKRRSATKENP